ncbi:50S ribosomal protein L18e [uncultured archaeon]|nr:50S ribosomal protein L18e [uncultured archaeon]
MAKKGIENPVLRKLVVDLEKTGRKNKNEVWIEVARLLKKPSRIRASVNLNKLSKLKGKDCLVPGKVLSQGAFAGGVIVAFQYSDEAKAKILKAGGKAYSFNEYLKVNPKGSNTIIVM